MTSDLREIPDSQEVFAHTCTGQSIIIEVMEYEESEDDDQALRYASKVSRIFQENVPNQPREKVNLTNPIFNCLFVVAVDLLQQLVNSLLNLFKSMKLSNCERNSATYFRLPLAATDDLSLQSVLIFGICMQ
ncbi:uncharacterized protein [Watersipora subatra]|uniref:uncharacterized protein n=1 Tax=Watersipora subatra TaxID=2589382 RepID=UPI00355BA30D